MLQIWMEAMKRVLLYFFLIAVNFFLVLSDGESCMGQEAKTTIEESELYAQSAVLMDADSGRVLFGKNAEAILPMASTTKIMTCILALERGNMEDLAEVSDYAASMPKVKLHMQKGETFRLNDLLYSLMLESHNDSAVAIAEHIGGSVEGFADMMNQKAQEIGCKNTYFITPNGLDSQKEITSEEGTKTVMHSTTAVDLALIMSYCIKKSPKKDAFLEITRTPSYSFTNSAGTRSFSCTNHNAFLKMMDGALSGKTGFTGKAGYCYVGALERDGRTFAVSLLACGWPNNKSYKWSDTKKLMKYGLSNYQKKDLSAEPVSKEWLKKIPVEEAQTRHLYGKASVCVSVRDHSKAPELLMKEGETVKVECNVEKKLKAPVRQGQQIGKIRYLLDGKVLWERKLCTEASLEKVNYRWFFQKVAEVFFVL